MVQIYNTDQSTIIAGVYYPKNTLSFNPNPNGVVDVYYEKNLIFSDPYYNFANTSDIPYSSQAALITELEKNHQSLEAEIQNIDINVDEVEDKLDQANTTLDGILLALGGSVSTAFSHSVVPASITQVTLIAANPDRKDVTIHNNSNSNLYIKYITGVTSSSFTYKLFKQDSLFIDDTKDNIYGIWDSAIGDAQITEENT